MRTIGAFEAKTHFSQLLDQVEEGEEITITRHGQAIAVLIPRKIVEQKHQLHDLIEELKQIREGQDRGQRSGTSVKELIETGRR